jgi:hypothetical protein
LCSKTMLRVWKNSCQTYPYSQHKPLYLTATWYEYLTEVGDALALKILEKINIALPSPKLLTSVSGEVKNDLFNSR